MGQAVRWRRAGLLEVAWWLPVQVWVCRVRWWELRAPLSGSQAQPSPVGLIQGQGREQRATMELLSVLRVLPAQKSRVRLVRVSLLPELFLQERWLRVRWLAEQLLQEVLLPGPRLLAVLLAQQPEQRPRVLRERELVFRPLLDGTSMVFSRRAECHKPVRDG